METGSETESYDDDSEAPDSPTEDEDSYRKQPRTWREAYGQMQKHAYQLVLSEKCKSYSPAKEISKPVGGDVLGSSALINLSGKPSGRRSPKVRIKVGKGHQMCTGCSKFIGSAAQVCSFPFMKFSFSHSICLLYSMSYAAIEVILYSL